MQMFEVSLYHKHNKDNYSVKSTWYASAAIPHLWWMFHDNFALHSIQIKKSRHSIFWSLILIFIDIYKMFFLANLIHDTESQTCWHTMFLKMSGGKNSQALKIRVGWDFSQAWDTFSVWSQWSCGSFSLLMYINNFVSTFVGWRIT